MQSLEDDPAPSIPTTRPDEDGGWTAPEVFEERPPVLEGFPEPAAGLPVGSPTEITVEIPLGQWPNQADLLEWCRESDNIVAAVLIFAGVAYALFGYQMYRLLACLNIAGLGAWAGWAIGKPFDATVPGMVVGAVLAAAIAWPAVRLAVAGCGGIVGFAIGCAVWRALGMADVYAPAGGAIGAIFLFMLSFVAFRASIIAFTAAQGAIMFAGGLLGIFLKYPEFDEPIVEWTADQPVILPVALFALAVVGLFYQQAYGPKPEAAGKS